MNFNYTTLAELYKDTLFSNVIPFWLNHSIDAKNGGYFTCLDRRGKVFDTDKFMWLQGRQAWFFSMIYNTVDQKEEWLDAARIGIDFLVRCGADREGKFYFSANAEGKPLVESYNIFSDCFATMAFSQYAKATGDESIKQRAVDTLEQILSRQHNPKGIYEKSTGVRPLKGFALPMILSNLAMELEGVLDQSVVDGAIKRSVYEVMDVFRDPDTGLIYEFVQPDGSFHDSFDGRLLNPGHGIEAMWFMMDIGVKNNDQSLIDKAADSVLKLLEYSWDTKYGGLFYFMDVKGYPPQQLEWDQKLWWVHLETLIALAKGYALTGKQPLWDWYQKVHEYTWSRFPDPEYGEWFGYLNRQGDPLLTLKGGKWKGCFHVPRALYQCWRIFDRLAKQEN